jgi:hypothetical protein
MNRDDMREIAEFAILNFNVPPRQVPREEMWERLRRTRERNAHTGTGAGRSRFMLRSGRSFSWRGRRGWIALPMTALAAAAVVVMVDMRTPSSSRRVELGSAGGAAQLAAEQAYATALAGIARFSSVREPWLEVVTIADDPATDAFRRAAVIHLTRSEAFIAGFRTRSAGAAIGREARNATRQLLMTTRMLVSSPLAARLHYKPVFQDLELVLVRMSLMTQETLTADKQDIEQTIERKKLLARMRELIPQTSTSNAN